MGNKLRISDAAVNVGTAGTSRKAESECSGRAGHIGEQRETRNEKRASLSLALRK